MLALAWIIIAGVGYCVMVEGNTQGYAECPGDFWRY